MRRIISILLSSVILLVFSCEDNLLLNDIYGSWKVSQQSISGKMKDIITPPEGSSFTDISITIPDTVKGTITGNTFKNQIWVGFEIKDGNHIIFKNYGGTRILDDPYGGALQENLLNSVKFNIIDNKLLLINSLGQLTIELVKDKRESQ